MLRIFMLKTSPTPNRPFPYPHIKSYITEVGHIQCGSSLTLLTTHQLAMVFYNENHFECRKAKKPFTYSY
jgi:hypothetical protein